MNPERKICIIGIGNTLRSDDAIGAYVCSEIEKANLPGVSTLVVQQINTEMIEPLLDYQYLLFVDAAVQGNQVDLHKLADETTRSLASSHNMSVSMFRDLARDLYNSQPNIFLCSVPGQDFGLGECLSPTGRKNAMKAVEKITQLVATL